MSGSSKSNVHYYFVDYPPFFDRDALYGTSAGDYPDNAERFALFSRAVLEAYARGVNAWIAARGRFSAPEFLVLGAPEPWQPSDSLLWGETMGLWLSANWRTELSRLSLAGKTPQWMIDTLWPPDSAAGRRSSSSESRSNSATRPTSSRIFALGTFFKSREKPIFSATVMCG